MPTAGFIDLIFDLNKLKKKEREKRKKKKQDSPIKVYVIGKLKVYTEEKGN